MYHHLFLPNHVIYYDQIMSKLFLFTKISIEAVPAQSGHAQAAALLAKHAREQLFPSETWVPIVKESFYQSSGGASFARLGNTISWSVWLLFC